MSNDKKPQEPVYNYGGECWIYNGRRYFHAPDQPSHPAHPSLRAENDYLKDLVKWHEAREQVADRWIEGGPGVVLPEGCWIEYADGHPRQIMVHPETRPGYRYFRLPDKEGT